MYQPTFIPMMKLLVGGIVAIALIAPWYECYIASEHYCPDGGLDIPPQNWFPIVVLVAFLYFILTIQEPMPVTPKADWPVGGGPECSNAPSAKRSSKGSGAS